MTTPAHTRGRYLMKTLDKEFKQMKKSTSVGRIIERITVRDLSVGTSLPLVERVWIQRSKNGKVGRGVRPLLVPAARPLRCRSSTCWCRSRTSACRHSAAPTDGRAGATST